MADGLTTQSATPATLPSGSPLATYELGTSLRHVGLALVGCVTTTAVAAGTSANTVIKASKGILGRVLVTTAGTAAMIIYDNATTNSGTKIGVIPANTPAGAVFDFQMPALLGITIDGDANNPAVTVAFA